MNQAQENSSRKPIYITKAVALELKTIWECAMTGHPVADDEAGPEARRIWSLIGEGKAKLSDLKVKEENK